MDTYCQAFSAGYENDRRRVNYHIRVKTGWTSYWPTTIDSYDIKSNSLSSAQIRGAVDIDYTAGHVFGLLRDQESAQCGDFLRPAGSV